MAAPVDAGRAKSEFSSALGTWPCNLPSGIQAGDLLILYVRAADTASINTPPTGWTTKIAGMSDGHSDDRMYVFYKTADGSEGSSVLVTWSTGFKGHALAYRITGWDTSWPNGFDYFAGDSTAPINPGNVVGLDAGKEYLIIATGAGSGETVFTAGPAGYSNFIALISGTGGSAATNSVCAAASKQVTGVTSEDPGAFTGGNQGRFITFVIAAPSAAATPINISVTLTLTPTVSLLKQFRREISVALTLVPTVTRLTVSRVISLPLSLVPSVLRPTISRQKTVALTMTPTVTRTVNRRLAVAFTLVPSVLRTIPRVITVPLTLAVTVSKSTTFQRIISVALTLTPTVRRDVNRQIAVPLPLTATVSRRVNRLLSVPLTLAASVRRTVDRKIVTPLTMTPTVVRTVRRNLSTALTFATSVTATKVTASITNIQLTVALALTPTVRRTVMRQMSVPLTLAPTVRRVVGRNLSVSLPTSVSIARRINRNVVVPLVLVPTVSLWRTVLMQITVTLNMAASVALTFVPDGTAAAARMRWNQAKGWLHRTTRRRIDP